MRVTSPSSMTPGSAENDIRAACPTAILEMSTSFTCTLTVIWERSAICTSGPADVVPSAPWESPPAAVEAPSTAFITTMEPATGAVTVRPAARATDAS